jgi:hypothetical protein
MMTSESTLENSGEWVREFIAKQLVISLILGAIPWLCIAQVWIETKGTLQFVSGYLERTPQEYIIVGAIVLLVLQIIYATIRGSFLAMVTNHSEFAFWKPRLALLVLQIGTVFLNYIPFNLIS